MRKPGIYLILISIAFDETVPVHFMSAQPFRSQRRGASILSLLQGATKGNSLVCEFSSTGNIEFPHKIVKRLTYNIIILVTMLVIG